MASHTDFTWAADVKVYFSEPQSPWQRETNEKTKLLLRGPQTQLRAEREARLQDVTPMLTRAVVFIS
jgi:IS30 family transposase